MSSEFGNIRSCKLETDERGQCTGTDIVNFETKDAGGVRNVFIKNLHKNIDQKALYDIFSDFGNILSCKVATDEKGQSKGFGFVHFETEKAAKTSIEQLNGIVLCDKKVHVCKFIPRNERENKSEEKVVYINNVYVKNLDLEYDDEKLKGMFEPYGKVTSCKVMIRVDGTSKGFGFVEFETIEAAEAAIKALNGNLLGAKRLFVAHVKKKAERRCKN